jgi:hypothetical protein
LSRIGRLVMDLSHSTSCTHKFSKTTHPIRPSPTTGPIPRELKPDFSFYYLKKMLTTNGRYSDPRPLYLRIFFLRNHCSQYCDACNSRPVTCPWDRIARDDAGRPPSLYQHAVILSAIRPFKEQSFSIQHTALMPDVDASLHMLAQYCGCWTTCYVIQDSRKFMGRLPAALCYLPSMTMMDPASPVRIVPAWSRLPNNKIKIARR